MSRQSCWWDVRTPIRGALIAVTIVGCTSSTDSDDGEPPVPVAESVHAEREQAAKEKEDSGASVSGGNARKQFDGVSFMIPSEWRELEKGAFVDAKYVIPSDKGEMELTMTTMGGGIADNLSRWIGQFQSAEPPDRSTIDIGTTNAEWLDLRGTFSSRVSGNTVPKHNWRLLGIAIPLTPRDFYLKLTGPREAVEAFKDEFRDFAESADLER